MSAQRRWKHYYRQIIDGWIVPEYIPDQRNDMYSIRREAALERALESAQRKINSQAQRIGELESMLILYMDGLPTGPAGYTSWPVAPLHDQARNVIRR